MGGAGVGGEGGGGVARRRRSAGRLYGSWYRCVEGAAELRRNCLGGSFGGERREARDRAGDGGGDSERRGARAALPGGDGDGHSRRSPLGGGAAGEGCRRGMAGRLHSTTGVSARTGSTGASCRGTKRGVSATMTRPSRLMVVRLPRRYATRRASGDAGGDDSAELVCVDDTADTSEKTTVSTCV